MKLSDEPTYVIIGCIFFVCSFYCCDSLDSDSIVIVVLDQASDNSSNAQFAEFETGLKKFTPYGLPRIVSIQRNFTNVLGAWAVIPVIPRLARFNLPSAEWYFFCLPSTRLHLPKLVEFLSNHNPDEPSWFGYGLHDREPTIIHHFSLLTKAKDKFVYPLFSSGFVFSQSLLSLLADRWSLNSSLEDLHPSEFTIDPSHELALFIWDEGRGPNLQHSAKFCLAKGPNCISYPVNQAFCEPSVPTEEMFFAVKTCGKFHKSRVPFVLQTWAKKTKHFAMYTDTPDSSIPGLVDLKVPNTANGHCGKTEAIIKNVAEIMLKDPKLHWLLIADDDTILSVERLQEFLSCYSATKEPLALGERYGFRLFDYEVGYNYLTGGGGMVLNKGAVELLSKDCKCPSIDFPDDMYIMGLCLSKLRIPILHSSLFHQARPDDYAPEYLAMQQPLSFHKHWLIDPLDVYKNWFDADFLPETSKLNVHIEL